MGKGDRAVRRLYIREHSVYFRKTVARPPTLNALLNDVVEDPIVELEEGSSKIFRMICRNKQRLCQQAWQLWVNNAEVRHDYAADARIILLRSLPEDVLRSELEIEVLYKFVINQSSQDPTGIARVIGQSKSKRAVVNALQQLRLECYHPRDGIVFQGNMPRSEDGHFTVFGGDCEVVQFPQNSLPLMNLQVLTKHKKWDEIRVLLDQAQSLATIAPPSGFGELSTLTEVNRASSVRAGPDGVELLVTPKQVFLDLHASQRDSKNGGALPSEAIDFLRQSGLANNISSLDLVASAKSVVKRTLSHGEVLYCKGEPVNSIFLVVSGEFILDVSESRVDGKHLPFLNTNPDNCYHLSSGSILGDEGLLGQSGRFLSTAVAISEIAVVFEAVGYGLSFLAERLGSARYCALAYKDLPRWSAPLPLAEQANLYTHFHSLRRCISYQKPFRGSKTKSSLPDQESARSEDFASPLMLLHRLELGSAPPAVEAVVESTGKSDLVKTRGVATTKTGEKAAVATGTASHTNAAVSTIRAAFVEAREVREAAVLAPAQLDIAGSSSARVEINPLTGAPSPTDPNAYNNLSLIAAGAIVIRASVSGVTGRYLSAPALHHATELNRTARKKFQDFFKITAQENILVEEIQANAGKSDATPAETQQADQKLRRAMDRYRERVSTRVGELLKMTKTDNTTQIRQMFLSSAMKGLGDALLSGTQDDSSLEISEDQGNYVNVLTQGEGIDILDAASEPSMSSKGNSSSFSLVEQIDSLTVERKKIELYFMWMDRQNLKSFSGNKGPSAVTGAERQRRQAVVVEAPQPFVNSLDSSSVMEHPDGETSRRSPPLTNRPDTPGKKLEPASSKVSNKEPSTSSKAWRPSSPAARPKDELVLPKVKLERKQSPVKLRPPPKSSTIPVKIVDLTTGAKLLAGKQHKAHPASSSPKKPQLIHIGHLASPPSSPSATSPTIKRTKSSVFKKEPHTTNRRGSVVAELFEKRKNEDKTNFILAGGEKFARISVPNSRRVIPLAAIGVEEDKKLKIEHEINTTLKQNKILEKEKGDQFLAILDIIDFPTLKNHKPGEMWNTRVLTLRGHPDDYNEIATCHRIQKRMLREGLITKEEVLDNPFAKDASDKLHVGKRVKRGAIPNKRITPRVDPTVKKLDSDSADDEDSDSRPYTGTTSVDELAITGRDGQFGGESARDYPTQRSETADLINIETDDAIIANNNATIDVPTPHTPTTARSGFSSRRMSTMDPDGARSSSPNSPARVGSWDGDSADLKEEFLDKDSLRRQQSQDSLIDSPNSVQSRLPAPLLQDDSPNSPSQEKNKAEQQKGESSGQRLDRNNSDAHSLSQGSATKEEPAKPAPRRNIRQIVRQNTESRENAEAGAESREHKAKRASLKPTTDALLDYQTLMCTDRESRMLLDGKRKYLRESKFRLEQPPILGQAEQIDDLGFLRVLEGCLQSNIRQREMRGHVVNLRPTELSDKIWHRENAEVQDRLNNIVAASLGRSEKIEALVKAKIDADLPSWQDFTIRSALAMKRSEKMTFPVLVRGQGEASDRKRTKRWGNGQMAVLAAEDEETAMAGPPSYIDVYKNMSLKKHGDAVKSKTSLSTTTNKDRTSGL